LIEFSAWFDPHAFIDLFGRKPSRSIRKKKVERTDRRIAPAHVGAFAAERRELPLPESIAGDRKLACTTDMARNDQRLSKFDTLHTGLCENLTLRPCLHVRFRPIYWSQPFPGDLPMLGGWHM